MKVKKRLASTTTMTEGMTWNSFSELFLSGTSNRISTTNIFSFFLVLTFSNQKTYRVIRTFFSGSNGQVRVFALQSLDSRKEIFLPWRSSQGHTNIINLKHCNISRRLTF